MTIELLCQRRAQIGRELDWWKLVEYDHGLTHRMEYEIAKLQAELSTIENSIDQIIEQCPDDLTRS